MAQLPAVRVTCVNFPCADAPTSTPSPQPGDGASSSAARAGPEQGPIICPGHSRPVPDIRFTNDTPDGYFLISACLDNKAMLRDGTTGDWIGTFMGHKGQKEARASKRWLFSISYCSIPFSVCVFLCVLFPGAVWCARLNGPATQAATAAADFSAKLWDALTGAEVHSLPHKHIVKSVCFSADGAQLYTGGQEKKVRIFDLNKLGSDPTILEDHKANITGVWTCKDENLIISAGAEKDIRVWDRRTNSVVKRLETTGALTSSQTSLDGSILSVTTTGKEVLFYRTDDWSLMKSFTIPREAETVAFDSVHNRFVTGSPTELWVRCYDYVTGDEVACQKGHHGPVRSLAFAPHYNSFASGSEDGTIRIWQWAGIELNKNKDESERAIEKK
jgi:serine-threonine kinase receptor-associated protein